MKETNGKQLIGELKSGEEIYLTKEEMESPSVVHYLRSLLVRGVTDRTRISIGILLTDHTQYRDPITGDIL